MMSFFCSQCSVGLEVDDLKEFHEEFLPDAVTHILILSRRLQSKFCKTSQVSQMFQKLLLFFMILKLQDQG